MMAEPRITLRARHSSTGSNLPITRVVIHATCGGRGYPRESAAGVARQTASYFQNPAAGGSAHYVCDVASEEHTLDDDAIAWHAPPNGHSIGIEICADGGEPYKNFKPYTREQWLSPQVWPAVRRAAARTRELCDRHGLPVRRLTVAQLRAGAPGICGHADVSAAFGQTDHTDPGPSFPWDAFLAAVKNPTPEEIMPKVVSLGTKSPQTIAPGETLPLVWVTEYADDARFHASGGTAVLADGTYWCIASALIRLEGLEEGDWVTLSWTRHSRDGKQVRDDAWTVPSPKADASGVVACEIGGQFQIDATMQLRLRVSNPLAYPVTVQRGGLAKLTLLAR